MNEAELVECCKRKDMTAQNELYQRYAGEMFALCIRYSGNRDFAKDLLHDGFLNAFTSLDKFFYRGEGSLKAWLSRIMVNTALEAIRKQTIVINGVSKTYAMTGWRSRNSRPGI